MNNFFFLTGPNNPSLGAARLEGSARYLRNLLATPEYVAAWTPITFIVASGQVCDYQPNNAGARLCSGRLQAVLDRGRTDVDAVQWLPTMVIEAGGQALPYWILHFPIAHDVLDKKKTTFVPDTDLILKPYFDRGLIERHRIFTFPDAALGVIVRQDIKNAVIEAGCTGVDFIPALVG